MEGGYLMAKAYEFIKAQQRSQEWLEIRKAGLGASDIAAVVGVSPYKTPWQLWAEKSGIMQPQKVGAAAQRGVLLEDAVAKWFELETGNRTRNSNGVVRLVDHPWAMASLDRTIVGSKDLLEIKTSSSPRWQMYPVPPEVYAQIQWQAMIMQAPVVWVAALLGGLVFRLERVEANPEYQRNLFAAGQDFMRRVREADAPELDGKDSSAYALAHPQESEQMVEASPEIERLFNAYKEASYEAKLAEQHSQDLEVQIKQAIGEAAGIFGRGWLATWKQSKPSQVVDWEAIANEMGANPPLILKHTKERPGSRRFTWKEAGE